MKYNTLSTSTVASEGKKATFKIYADLDIAPEKVSYTDEEMHSVRQELEKVQKDLNVQTKRCRQLVSEYTQKLREKELLYQNEKDLRDTQLARIIKTLLIFEARLKKEQKFINCQLQEKDYIIRKQRNDIKRLLANTYCKNCQQYYTPSPQLESLDSSSEYVPTEHEYQSSNFESLDSSAGTYGTLSEKSENISKYSVESLINKSEDSSFERSRKRDSPDSNHYEPIKLRADSPMSSGDNTSADYDNFDSLPAEAASEKISVDFRLKKEMINYQKSDESTDDSECAKTVINSLNKENLEKHKNEDGSRLKKRYTSTKKEIVHLPENKLSDAIPVFESANEGNENWYASASDQEDDDRTDLYRNNPVLECVNQILLQNINDPMNSPPNERKNAKNGKRVKFSDKEEQILTEENVKSNSQNQDYYETPIQKTPNFYETPQSIYSNDYEQILSKCSQQTFSDSPSYVEMETKKPPIKPILGSEEKDSSIVRKSKILRTPPALPPKPPNLLSKYKINILPQNVKKPQAELNKSSDAEPDYCSISELNLPQQKKSVSFKKISVVAEINSPTQIDVLTKINAPSPAPLKNKPDLLDIDPSANLIVKKCIEKINIQVAKKSEVSLSVPKSPQKSDGGAVMKSSPKKIELSEIPKLPQVSEIIIPSDSDDQSCTEERIASDNYVKNNSELLKNKKEFRKSLPIGSSISSIINEFNSHKILPLRKPNPKIEKRKFASFENLQNLDKHFTIAETESQTPKFEEFDLSQNFEEFKLDECEIEEFKMDDLSDDDFGQNLLKNDIDMTHISETDLDPLVPTLNVNSVEELRKQLEIQKNKKLSPEPNYEHFLECTGLSSKSILTPSRILGNHKSALKPKDVKLRSRVKANNIFERYNGATVKYWSEPFV